MTDDVTKQTWDVVGHPWNYPDMPAYIIAGHYDPHLGTPVCDLAHPPDDIEEGDTRDYIAESYAVARHITAMQKVYMSSKAFRRIVDELKDGT